MTTISKQNNKTLEDAIIDLYLCVKIRKQEEVNFIFLIFFRLIIMKKNKMKSKKKN